MNQQSQNEQRISEKEFLSQITHDLLVSVNKNDIIKAIHEHLQKKFYFSHLSVFILNDASQEYSGYIFDLKSKARSQSAFFEHFKTLYPVNIKLFAPALKHGEPIIINFDQIDFYGLPAWLRMEVECGSKECMIIMLQTSSKLVGFLALFSDGDNFNKENFRIVEAFSPALAHVLAGILLKDQFILLENERSKTSSIGSEVMFVTTVAQLEDVIESKLINNHIINDYCILKIDGVTRKLSSYLIDKAQDDVLQYEFSEIYDKILSIDAPLLFDTEKLIDSPHIPAKVAGWLTSPNYDIVAKALRTKEVDLGVVWIKTLPLDTNLLNVICRQILVAMNNIDLNERILALSEELARYKQQLHIEKSYTQDEIRKTHYFGEIIGTSSSMLKIFNLISKVAITQTSVLIMGETGTGKELIARAIHNNSSRKNKTMIKINCAALPPNIIESELFGHEKGSFTGAIVRRIGKFELANNSTLFLDEIGELPPELQVKLLRVLQEKEIERIGGSTVIKTDVRIIAATNRDLLKEVEAGNFRSDLYFRLNVFPILIPPLRERRDDIPKLAGHFLEKYSPNGTKRAMTFSSKVIKQLTGYPWPGNVRELEHLIERTILLSSGQVISQINLASQKNEKNQEYVIGSGQIKTIDEVEKEHIIKVLRLCMGKVAGIGGAAELLKIPSTTLNSKIRRLNIKKVHQLINTNSLNS